MNNIKRVSLIFRVIFQIVFVVHPILFVAYWINAPQSLNMFGGMVVFDFIPRAYTATASHASAVLHQLSMLEKFSAFAASTVPLLIELFIYYSLIQLFRLYEQGKIFAQENVMILRRIGLVLVARQLLNPIYEAIMGLILTWHNPPGHRFAAVTFDQTNFAMLLTALLVLLISWIMMEGCKLREEQQLTI